VPDPSTVDAEPAPASEEPAFSPGKSDYPADALDVGADDTRADEAAVAAEAASAGFAPATPVAPPADPAVEAAFSAPTPPGAEFVGAAETSDDRAWDEGGDDDFSPFARREPAGRRSRTGVIALAVVLLLVAIAAAAIWMLAPGELRERLGLAGASETPLQLMMTHSDRRTLASGNELLSLGGRVINPTEETQPVPPIHAQLHSSSGQLVHSWTIPPPVPTLPPGQSAEFNSANLDIPAGGDELTVTLGEPKA
jgi:hypothetical protein